MSWDGRFYSMSIDPEGCPELYRELSSLASRARAERLRALALVGLTALRGGVVLNGEPSLVARDCPDESGKAAARKLLSNRLLGGI